jgi:hypothetical protein
MRALAAVALAALAAAPVSAQLNPRPPAKTEMRVYDLGLNDPAVATEIIRALLSRKPRLPRSRQHRLVVSTHPDVHVRVAEAEDMNVAPQHRIEVSARMGRTDRERQLSERHRRRADRVGVGRRPPRTGVVIAGQDSRSRTTVHAQQQLLVLSGGRASLTVAEEVPYSEWLYTWGLGHGLWAQNVVWQEVGTSMVVEPRALGNGTILVRLTPRFDYRAGGNAQTVDVTELSTEVIVRAGEEIALGGVPFRDTDFRERFLAGVNEAGQTARVEMTLRATVE